MLATRFTKLVGCGAPIQLAGMGIGSTELAAAVARAGGLGTISSAWLGGPERAGPAIDGIGDVTPGALAVNVLVCMPEQVELVDVVSSHVRLIDFSGVTHVLTSSSGHTKVALWCRGRSGRWTRPRRRRMPAAT